MTRRNFVSAVVSFEQVSKIDHRRRASTDVALIARGLLHSPNLQRTHVESLARSLQHMQTEIATTEALRLQASRHHECGDYFEAALTLEDALQKTPGNIDIAARFHSSIGTLWNSLHELILKNPKAPSITSIFEYLQERGYVGLEGYILIAHHFFQTNQTDRARLILTNVRQLTPNHQMLTELQTLDDCVDIDPEENVAQTEATAFDPRVVARLVTELQELYSLTNREQYKEILTKTESLTKNIEITQANESQLACRAIALDCIGRHIDSLRLLLRLREFNPYRVDYFKSQFIACRNIAIQIEIMLCDPDTKIEDVNELVGLVKRYGIFGLDHLILLAGWYLAHNEVDRSLAIVTPLFNLMPNDNDVQSGILSLPDHPVVIELKLKVLQQVRQCRAKRPFDFRYWSARLAEVRES